MVIDQYAVEVVHPKLQILKMKTSNIQLNIPSGYLSEDKLTLDPTDMIEGNEEDLLLFQFIKHIVVLNNIITTRAFINYCVLNKVPLPALSVIMYYIIFTTKRPELTLKLFLELITSKGLVIRDFTEIYNTSVVKGKNYFHSHFAFDSGWKLK